MQKKKSPSTTTQTNITIAHKHYRKAREHQKKGDLKSAIKEYKTYSNHLYPKDRHIPYQWISTMYEELGNKKEALAYLKLYVEGCSPAHAKKMKKEIRRLS